jgi:hypothetical protein
MVDPDPPGVVTAVLTGERGWCRSESERNIKGCNSTKKTLHCKVLPAMIGVSTKEASMDQGTRDLSDRRAVAKSAREFREAHRGKLQDGNEDVTADWELTYDEEMKALTVFGNVSPKDPAKPVWLVCTYFTPTGSEMPIVAALADILDHPPDAGEGVTFALDLMQPRPREPVDATLSGYVSPFRYFEFTKKYTPPAG